MPGDAAAGGSLRFLLRGQAVQAGAAIAFGAVAWALAAPALGGGTWLGVPETTWFWAAIGVAVVHQAYTWLAFRGQLGWGVFTRWVGRRDLAVHAAIFLPLLAARPLAIVALGLADRGSLLLPRWLSLALGVALLLPALYTGWSVARYFGLARAVGGDHFRRAYHERPFVAAGAFRWTPNAMYTFAFLGLWSLALLLDSQAALVAALFQHAFVWAHYVGTERPDLATIDGA